MGIPGFSMFKFLLKIPRIFGVIFLFIASCLLCFLLLGCVDDSSPVFSDVYLVRYQYNSNSSFFPVIENGYKNSNSSSNYANMEIRSGFLAICAVNGDELSCTSRNNLTSLAPFKNLNVYNGTSDNVYGSFDPVVLASVFSNNIVNPYCLITTLLLTVMTMIGTTCHGLPVMPHRSGVHQITVILGLLAWSVWTAGAMWIQIASNAASQIVPDASLGILQANVGSRAEAMTWTSFVFLSLAVMLSLFVYRKETKVVLDSKV
jgi:hypothetical protein